MNLPQLWSTFGSLQGDAKAAHGSCSTPEAFEPRKRSSLFTQDYVVVEPGTSKLEKQQLLTEEEYRAAREEYGEGAFEADMGAEAVRKLLMALDLVKLSVELRQDLGRNEFEAEEERT